MSELAEREKVRRSSAGGAASSGEVGGAPVSDSGEMVAYHGKLTPVSDAWRRGEASGKMETSLVVGGGWNGVAGAAGAAELRCGCGGSSARERRRQTARSGA